MWSSSDTRGSTLREARARYRQGAAECTCNARRLTASSSQPSQAKRLCNRIHNPLLAQPTRSRLPNSFEAKRRCEPRKLGTPSVLEDVPIRACGHFCTVLSRGMYLHLSTSFLRASSMMVPLSAILNTNAWKESGEVETSSSLPVELRPTCGDTRCDRPAGPSKRSMVCAGASSMFAELAALMPLLRFIQAMLQVRRRPLVRSREIPSFPRALRGTRIVSLVTPSSCKYPATRNTTPQSGIEPTASERSAPSLPSPRAACPSSN